MLSLIDEAPYRPGWGRIYQSGVIASEDWDDAGLIVSLSGNENWQSPCLWLNMADNEDHVLPRELLIALVSSILAFLEEGFDVLIHCNEGKYRSTYMDVAVHMGLGASFDEAFGLIKLQHPIADLRAGTKAQLLAMEAQLMGVQ